MKTISLKIKIIAAILAVVLLSAGLAVVMTACDNDDDSYRKPLNGEPEAGKFYSLQTAYDNGWISRGDLRNIEYHRTGDAQKKGFVATPKNPEVLSEETKLAIRESYAKSLREQDIAEAVADGVLIVGYFGIYDGFIALKIDSEYFGNPDVVYEETIGGIRFVYGNANTITLWKITE